MANTKKTPTLTPFVKPRQVLSYLVLAIAPFLSVKLAQSGRETIQSVKVRVHRAFWSQEVSE